MAEVLANDMASGDIDDWEQYLLKGIEARESTGHEQLLGFFPSGDGISYFRKKREAAGEDNADSGEVEEQ